MITLNCLVSQDLNHLIFYYPLWLVLIPFVSSVKFMSASKFSVHQPGNVVVSLFILFLGQHLGLSVRVFILSFPLKNILLSFFAIQNFIVHTKHFGGIANLP